MFILADRAEFDYVKCVPSAKVSGIRKMKAEKLCIYMIVEQYLRPCLDEADSVAVSPSQKWVQHARLKRSTASKAGKPVRYMIYDHIVHDRDLW